ncbi:hypothetical protein TMEC54S_00430 [Thauera mechernichensis]
MRYKLVQSVALVTSFWWFCLTLYGLFDGSWNGAEELSSYVLEVGSSISLAVFIAIGIVVSAYIINEYLVSKYLKGKRVRGLSCSLGAPPIPSYHIPMAQNVPQKTGRDSVDRWLSYLKRAHPEHYRLAKQILRILLSDPKMPASHVRGGHGGKTLWEHSLLVCERAIVIAPTWTYEGLKTPKGDLVTALRDTSYTFDPADPLVGIIALAHDIGKLKTFLRDPKTGEVLKETHEHDSVSALMVTKLDEFWQIPRSDQEAILGAVGYYHRPQSFPLDKGQRAYDDRTHALMELLIAADRSAGQIESGIAPSVQTGQQTVEFMTRLWAAFHELTSEPGRVNGSNKAQTIGQKRGEIVVFKERELLRFLGQKLSISPTEDLKRALLEVLADQEVLFDPNPNMRSSSNPTPPLRTYSVSFFNASNGKHLATWRGAVVIMPKHILPGLSSLFDHPALFEVHTEEAPLPTESIAQGNSPVSQVNDGGAQEQAPEEASSPAAEEKPSNAHENVEPDGASSPSEESAEQTSAAVSAALDDFIAGERGSSQNNSFEHDLDGLEEEGTPSEPDEAADQSGSGDVLDEDVMQELSKVIEKQAEEKAVMIVEKEEELERERKEKQLKKLPRKDKDKLSQFGDVSNAVLENRNKENAVAFVLNSIKGQPYKVKRGLNWYKASSFGLTDEGFSKLAAETPPGFIELARNENGELIWVGVPEALCES